MGAAARDLDLTETALREWVRRAQADRTKGRTRLTTPERDELAGSAKRIGSCGRSRASHEGSRQRYGQPRIWKDLREGGRARQ